MNSEAQRQGEKASAQRAERWRPVLLLVDDDDDVRESACLLLADEGYDVIEARDGADALEKLDDGLMPDVILTDLRMPVVDGVGLIRSLRAQARFGDVAVIAWSATPLDAGEIDGARVLSKAAATTTLLEAIADASRRRLS